MGGIIVALLTLEGVLRLGGFILYSVEEARNRSAIPGSRAYTIVCLGESTTMFGGIHSYPRQLERILNEHAGASGPVFRVINKGVPSHDTAYILSKLEPILSTYRPDVVIAMMGVNDSVRTPVYEDSSGVRLRLSLQEFRVARLIRLLGLHVTEKVNELFTGKKSVGARQFISETGIGPKTQYYYQVLGEYYESAGEYLRAERLYREAVGRKPDKSWSHEYLGAFLERQGRSGEAEGVFRNAIARNPKKTWGYVLLGQLYENIGKPEEAERVYLAAMSRIDKPKEILNDLGFCYAAQGKTDAAIEVFEGLIRSGGAAVGVYTHLGDLYLDRNEVGKAREMYTQAFRIDPTRTDMVIGRLARDGRFEMGEEILKNVVERTPERSLLSRQLGTLYRLWGKEGLAQEYFAKADEAGGAYHDATQANYRKLAAALKREGIRFICVQYPLRNVEPLRAVFDAPEEITFVENKRNFEAALASGPYNEYFTDRFAGDFGHCTRKGNRLLAENVAASVLSPGGFQK